MQKTAGVILGGRNNWELDVAAADTAIRHGTTTRTLPMDANDAASVDAAAAALLSAGPPPHRLTFVIECSDEPSRAAYDPDHADRILAANSSPDYLPHVQATSGHRIAFVSSVAGDRGPKDEFCLCRDKSCPQNLCPWLARATIAASHGVFSP
jgi:NAD(P)-dependent dehydrogenase (short-subunit alcohol dehydrogenase family)